MAKHQRKAQARLEARQKAYTPTGPSQKHSAKMPGSQNMKK